MRLRNKLATIGAALVLGGGGALIAQPASAITYGSIKICVTDGSFTSMGVHDTDSSYTEWVSRGTCTGWLYPVGIRVDTDPLGSSHSYRIHQAGGDVDDGWGPCHENSDNHNSDPPQSSSGYSRTITYKNYDGGNCNGNG